MGIFQLAQSGSNFQRQDITIDSSPSLGQSTGFGTSYILLGVTVESACRVRLYSDSASVALDEARPTSSFDIDPAVGLVVDAMITGSTTELTFDPPIIGTTFSTSATWYNISSSTAQNVTFTAYPIEFAEYPDERDTLTFMGADIPTASGGEQGNITSPKGFIILSGSTDTVARLRLYSRPVETVIPAEISRPFGGSPIVESSLIVDILFDAAGSYKLTPVLEAFNLEQYAQGSNQVGYILQNQSATAEATITASLYIYPIED